MDSLRVHPVERAAPAMERGRFGWVFYEAQNPALRSHMVPVCDIGGHALDPEGSCKCRPYVNEESDVWEHRPLDKRDEWEIGGGGRKSF